LELEESRAVPEISHEMNLAAAFQYVHPFLVAMTGSPFEIRCPLLELRKILDCFQRSLEPNNL